MGICPRSLTEQSPCTCTLLVLSPSRSLQGIGISAINSMGKISDPEDGKALQNFMICCEMAIAGIALLYAFPHREYQIGGSTSGFRLDAFKHAISVHDVVKDAIHVVSSLIAH